MAYPVPTGNKGAGLAAQNTTGGESKLYQKTLEVYEQSTDFFQQLEGTGRDALIKVLQNNLRLENTLNRAKKIGIEEDLINIDVTRKAMSENKKLNDSIEKLIQTTSENKLIIAGASEETLLFTKTLILFCNCSSL